MVKGICIALNPASFTTNAKGQSFKIGVFYMVFLTDENKAVGLGA